MTEARTPHVCYPGCTWPEFDPQANGLSRCTDCGFESALPSNPYRRHYGDCPRLRYLNGEVHQLLPGVSNAQDDTADERMVRRYFHDNQETLPKKADVEVTIAARRALRAELRAKYG